MAFDHDSKCTLPVPALHVSRLLRVRTRRGRENVGVAEFCVCRQFWPRPTCLHVVLNRMRRFAMAVNRQPEVEDDEMEVATPTAEQGKGRRKRNTSQMPPMKERLYSSYYRFRYGWPTQTLRVPLLKVSMIAFLLGTSFFRMELQFQHSGRADWNLVTRKMLSPWTWWVLLRRFLPLSLSSLMVCLMVNCFRSVIIPLSLLDYAIKTNISLSVDQDYSEGAPLHVLQFLEHFRSLPWMTYRSGFPPIARTSTTSDCGWGCMIRSGQMLLAATLHFHLLGRGMCHVR